MYLLFYMALVCTRLHMGTSAMCVDMYVVGLGQQLKLKRLQNLTCPDVVI